MQRGRDAVGWYRCRWHSWSWLDPTCTHNAAYSLPGIGSHAANCAGPLQAAVVEFVGNKTARRCSTFIENHHPLWMKTIIKWVNVISSYKPHISNQQIVLAEHNDHLTVARVLLNSETSKLGLGLSIPQLTIITHNFTGMLSLYSHRNNHEYRIYSTMYGVCVCVSFLDS